MSWWAACNGHMWVLPLTDNASAAPATSPAPCTPPHMIAGRLAADQTRAPCRTHTLKFSANWSPNYQAGRVTRKANHSPARAQICRALVQPRSLAAGAPSLSCAPATILCQRKWDPACGPGLARIALAWLKAGIRCGIQIWNGPTDLDGIWISWARPPSTREQEPSSGAHRLRHFGELCPSLSAGP